MGITTTIPELENLDAITTNRVFDSPIEWTNSLLEIEYVDTLRKHQQFQYSSGNRYDVFGGDGLDGITVFVAP